VIVTVTALETAEVETANVPLEAPTGIVTLPGSVAEAELSLSVTTALDEAAAESVIVHELPPPPVNVPGAHCRDDSEPAEPGVTTTEVKIPTVPISPPTETVVLEVTAEVVTTNVPDCLPAGMVMLAGADAGLISPVVKAKSETTCPPVPAASVRVTVQVVGDPPISVAGLQATEETFIPPPVLLLLPLPLLLPPLPEPVPLPEIVPPVVFTFKVPPEGSTATAARVTGVLLAAAVMVKVIDARTPLAMTFVFIPLATHV
jgi:hypothetical protein